MNKTAKQIMKQVCTQNLKIHKNVCVLQCAAVAFLNLGQLSIGLGIGFSSILIPQLQQPQEDGFSSIRIDVGITETSWIVSLISIGQIAGSVIGACLASAIGRKGVK